jgi:hypothetical protein
MKHPSLVIILAGLASTAAWVMSPYVTGHQEPWDADGFYYIATLAVGGLASGLLAPKPLWAHYAGSVSGQVIYELLFLELGPLLVVGFVFLLVYSLLFVGGAFLGSSIRLRFSDRTFAD